MKTKIAITKYVEIQTDDYCCEMPPNKCSGLQIAYQNIYQKSRNHVIESFCNMFSVDNYDRKLEINKEKQKPERCRACIDAQMKARELEMK